MDKNDVIEFFDRCAGSWDAEMIRSDSKISRILDNAGVTAGCEVLDVACGTGVLFPDYLARGVKSVTAVDISPEMVKIAAAKYPEEDIRVFCADIESFEPDRSFDCAVVYNAFPHFPAPDALIRRLAACVKPGGTVCVAHGMSRAMIDRHHSGSAHSVSMGLMSEDELAAIFAKYLTVTVKISDDEMYEVCGVKK